MFRMRTAVALVSVIAGGALAVMPATAASASTVYCTTTASVGTSDLWVPSISGTNTNCSLAKDATEGVTSVEALQTALVTCYGKSIAIDGSFGTATKNALIAVQTLIGASPDGMYGPETKSKLKFSSNDVPGHAGCKNL